MIRPLFTTLQRISRRHQATPVNTMTYEDIDINEWTDELMQLDPSQVDFGLRTVDELPSAAWQGALTLWEETNRPTHGV